MKMSTKNAYECHHYMGNSIRVPGAIQNTVFRKYTGLIFIFVFTCMDMNKPNNQTDKKQFKLKILILGQNRVGNRFFQNIVEQIG